MEVPISQPICYTVLSGTFLILHYIISNIVLIEQSLAGGRFPKRRDRPLASQFRYQHHPAFANCATLPVATAGKPATFRTCASHSAIAARLGSRYCALL